MMPPSTRVMMSPQDRPSATAPTVRGTFTWFASYVAGGPNHCGVPGAGKPCVGCGGGYALVTAWSGVHVVGAAGSATACVEWADPHAEPAVTTADTTWKGSTGSRVGAVVGTSAARGGTGSRGWSNRAGGSAGAPTDGSVDGGAALSGSIAGATKPVGHSTGAYSGPSSHVATAPCYPREAARLSSRHQSAVLRLCTSVGCVR